MKRGSEDGQDSVPYTWIQHVEGRCGEQIIYKTHSATECKWGGLVPEAVPLQELTNSASNRKNIQCIYKGRNAVLVWISKHVLRKKKYVEEQKHWGYL